METDNAADIPLDAMLENYIFYIFSMYEFSHSQDPKWSFAILDRMVGSQVRGPSILQVFRHIAYSDCRNHRRLTGFLQNDLRFRSKEKSHEISCLLRVFRRLRH